jgi:hypothetical protein
VGRRVKFKLQDTTPARVLFLDPDATEGATLGTNVFTPDGIVGTPATVRAWLNVTESNNPRERPPANTGVIHHRLLQGLTLGDDHPQYTQWAQNETIVKAWEWISPDGVADPQEPDVTSYEQIFLRNPDVTYRGGLQFTTLTDPLVDPETNGTGSQIAFWEVENAYGFRIRNAGHVDNEGDLDFYRHANDNDGVLFLKFTRDSDQVQFTQGSFSAPVITTIGGLTTGIYFPTTSSLGIKTGGTGGVWTASGTASFTSDYRQYHPVGSEALPTYAFDGDTNTGMTRAVAVANALLFVTDGTERLTIGNVDTAGGGATRGIRSTLSFRGPAGTATNPTFTFTTDDNTGFYSGGADVLAASVAGTLRWSITTAAVISTLPLSGANGSAGAPQYSFTSGLAMGMYRIGANNLGFSTNSTLRFAIDSGGAFGLGSVPDYGTTGQLLKSMGPGAPPEWVSAGAGVVVEIVGGHGIRVEDYADPTMPIVYVDEAAEYYWTDQHNFAGPTPQFSLWGADTRIDFHETNADPDESIWAIRTNNGQIFWEARSDDQASSSTAMSANRVGVAVSSLTLGNTTDLPDLVLRITEMQLNGDEGTSGQVLTSAGAGAAPTWETPGGGVGTEVQIFTADGTWTKPAGAAACFIICVGAGGGGGGGRKQAVGATRAGGGGGGGGGYSTASVDAADLAATVAVTVGTGGGGGAGASADNGTGTSGTDGGPSAFGTVIRATGGGGGTGATAATNAGGAAGVGTVSDGTAGGLGGTSTSVAGTDAKYAGAGGGGGGGVSSANNESGGKAGGGVTLTNPALTGGTAGAAGGTNGGAGNTTGDQPVPGSGGGGGGGEDTAGNNGGDGGDGGSHGGGGGGGGGLTNGAGIAGDGGDGANGVVIVITYTA